MAPIQQKMIEPSLLTEAEVGVALWGLLTSLCECVLQIDWLNNYHSQVRDTVGAYLLENGKNAVYRWLLRETEPLG